MRDIIGGAVLLVGAVALLLKAGTIRNPGFDPLGPAFLPQLILWVLIVASGVLIVQSVLALRRRPAAAAPESVSEGREYLLRAGGAVALIAGYIGLLHLRVPFEIASILFIGVVGFVLGLRGRMLLVLLGTAVAIAFVSGYVFKSVLYVNLP